MQVWFSILYETKFWKFECAQIDFKLTGRLLNALYLLWHATGGTWQHTVMCLGALAFKSIYQGYTFKFANCKRSSLRWSRYSPSMHICAHLLRHTDIFSAKQTSCKADSFMLYIQCCFTLFKTCYREDLCQIQTVFRKFHLQFFWASSHKELITRLDVN